MLRLIIPVVIIVIIVFVILIYAQFFIRKEMFDPTRISALPDITQNSMGYDSVEGYTISYSKRDDGKCYDKTVIFCRGRYGTMRDNVGIINAMKVIPINYILCDYPGYGLDYDKRSPNIDSCIMATRRMYSKSQKLWPHSEIVIWGHSLGSYFAIELANWIQENHKIKYKLIILSGLSSALDIGIDSRSAVHIMSQFLFPYSNTIIIKKLDCKTLILHSNDDDIIPVRCGKILVEAAKHPTYLEIMGTHSKPIIPKDIVRSILMFIGIDYTSKHVDKFAIKINDASAYFEA